jgi:hypothetical protein
LHSVLKKRPLAHVFGLKVWRLLSLQLQVLYEWKQEMAEEFHFTNIIEECSDSENTNQCFWRMLTEGANSFIQCLHKDTKQLDQLLWGYLHSAVGRILLIPVKNSLSLSALSATFLKLWYSYF